MQSRPDIPEAYFVLPRSRLIILLKKILRKELSRVSDEKMLEKLLSTKEAQKLFHPPVTAATLRNWEKKALIKSYKINGQKYYKYSELLSSFKTLKKYQINNSFTNK